MSGSYEAFVRSKMALPVATGLPDASIEIPPGLFPFQGVLSRWACRRGRAAIFAATGLGKSRMGLAWAKNVVRATGRDVLVLAPLAVARQTAREGAAIGVEVTVCLEAKDLRPGINVANYERLERFDPERFSGVLIDESSIIKHFDSSTFRLLCERFRETPFKLATTATPAPNDWAELGTHAEFLGVCTRQEMLAEFFVHDGGDTQTWRLKGHARGAFWAWVASWGALVSHPRDLGPEFDQAGYDLPPLRHHEHLLPVDAAQARAAGLLFVEEARGLMEQRQARKASLEARVRECVALVYAEATSGKPVQAPGSGRAEAETDSRADSLSSQLQETASREVRIHPRTAEGAEPQEARAVCGGLGIPRSGQAEDQREPESEPAEVQGRGTSPQVWSDASSLPSAPSLPGVQVRGVRILGQEQGQFLPSGGSLPPDGQGARPSLYELQHGDRQVQGRPEASPSRRRIPEPWIVWCNLNAEQDALEEAFGDDAFSVRGALEIDVKEDRIARWLTGERPVMISKASVMGWGLNLQFCRRMAFVGMDNSWEAWHQAVRRIWRFGQKDACDVHVFASEAEGAVIENVKRKDADALEMAVALARETSASVRESVVGARRTTVAYEPETIMKLPSWLRSGP